MDLENIYSKKNNIFQSDVWAEFQKAVGREPIEIDGIYFYKEHLIRDKYFLYCPKTINKVNETVGDKSIVFVRIEPGLDSCYGENDKKRGSKDKKIQKGSHPVETGKDPFWKPVTKNSILSQQYSPMQTLVLDLTKSEEEILANMKSKHRYNIRLAEKKGVKIRRGIGKKDIDDFYNLSLEVSDRDATFSPHPKSYYEKMVKTIGKKGNLQIFTSEYKGKPLSSIIILFYNDTAVYLHGASSNNSREVMPNHLAQWEAIKEAKKRGCKYYDFWGAALRNEKVKSKNEKSGRGLDSRCPPRIAKLVEAGGENDKNKETDKWVVDEGHAWAGITKFKLGFVKLGVTGEVVEFSGAYDLPIDKLWYNVLGWLNRIRKVFKK